MRHALVTTEWASRMTFEKLVGRPPLPLDPRIEAARLREQTDEDRDRIERAKRMLLEAQIRASGTDVVEAPDGRQPD